MTLSQGEYHQGWDNVTGGGRVVTVRSLADLPLVAGFIDDSGNFRRAVMLQNFTASERRNLVTAIEALGVQLRRLNNGNVSYLGSMADPSGMCIDGEISHQYAFAIR